MDHEPEGRVSYRKGSFSTGPHTTYLLQSTVHNGEWESAGAMNQKDAFHIERGHSVRALTLFSILNQNFLSR